MSPFLGSVGRWLLIFHGLAGLVLGGLVFTDTLSSPLLRMAYTFSLCASALAVLVGGGAAIRAQNAERQRVPDSILRPDRMDAAVGFYILGFFAGSLTGMAVSQAGECLIVVGCLVGMWIVSDSPLSPLLMLVVGGWTLFYAGWGMVFHNLGHFPWAMVPAALGLLIAAGLLKRFLSLRGPAGWAYTLVVFGWCLLAPLAAGIFGPEHELPSSKTRHDSPIQTFFIFNLALSGVMFYHWSLRAAARPGQLPPEGTQSGCGCTYLGFGGLTMGLDRLGGTLQGASGLAQAGAMLVAVLLVLALAGEAQRRIARRQTTS